MEPTDKDKAAMLRYAAKKAAERQGFMAWALDLYMRHEKIDQLQLADYLEIEPKQLPLLGLCLRPDTANNKAFQQGVKAICKKFGIKSVPLANLLRRVAAYASDSHDTTFLMAARDKEEDGDN
ncbi:hypothetical protein [Candidatus Chlorohelix sp.]|uniref:hypothetical protein n=1 Tax=Candidatus Chlorohelix sp. TaxID=3139201 RepID=UPI00302DB0D1